MTEHEMKQYFYLKSEIKVIEEEKKSLTIISGISYSNEATQPHYSKKSATERIVDRIFELEERLENKRIELINELERIEKFIESQPDSEIRIILRLRYTCVNKYTGMPYTWEEIGNEVFMFRKTCTNKVKEFWKAQEEKNHG